MGETTVSPAEARVLVAETDTDEASNVIDTIQEAQFSTEVEATPSGSRALELVQEERFDCLVLEFDLVDLNGLEVVRRLRETDEQTPVIVWTDRDAPALEDKLLEAGADAYLTKNDHDSERVKKRLQRLIERTAG